MVCVVNGYFIVCRILGIGCLNLPSLSDLANLTFVPISFLGKLRRSKDLGRGCAVTMAYTAYHFFLLSAVVTKYSVSTL